MEKSCGKVTPEERDTIRRLHTRRLALNELFQALAKMEPKQMEALYEKALADMGETTEAYHTWWDQTAHKYEWPGIQNGSWRINFETCEVFLVQS